MRILLAAILACFAIAGAPTVAAEPGPEYTCLFGYNPTALTNACYDPALYSQGVPAGGVETTPMEVCPVGNICAPVPIPAYNPDGSIGVPLPGGIYVELQGTPVVVDPAEMAHDFDDLQQTLEDRLEDGVCDAQYRVCIYTENGDPGVRVCEIVCNDMVLRLTLSRPVCDSVWYEQLVAVNSCIGKNPDACIYLNENEFKCIYGS